MIKRQKDKMKQTYQQPTIGIEEAEAQLILAVSKGDEYSPNPSYTKEFTITDDDESPSTSGESIWDD